MPLQTLLADRPQQAAEPRFIWRGDVEVLSRLPLFCSLSQDSFDQVLAEATINRFPQGATLIRQGEEARFLHVVLEGQVGLLGIAPNGDETIVEILREGEAFIAAAVLTERPYLMSAVALQASRVLLIPAEKLRQTLRGNADLAVAMLTSMATHYRMLVREVKDLKLKSAAQRLGHYLLSLTPKRAGPVMIRLPHPKGVMAARIGVRAETLSRAFAALREQGVVVKGVTVSIGNVAKLGEFCMEGDEPI